MQPTLFLRRVLALDALSCLGIGALLGMAPMPLAPAFGLPAELLFWAGIALLPIAAFMGFLATRQAPPPLLVWMVILGNLGWVIESFVVIGQLGASITPLGTAFVAVQALAVLGLAGLEYIGLRRSRGAVAA
jgi:hypothetical protein